MTKTLLHTCCAPCSVSCVEQLRTEGIEPVSYWFNPNIHPYQEYRARRDTLIGYAKQINMETFNSCILVDDDDQELAEPAMAIDFAGCEDDADGFKLLGHPYFEEIREEFPDAVNLLQLDEDDDLEMRFYDSGNFNILISASDLGFQNWSHAFGFLHSL